MILPKMIQPESCDALLCIKFVIVSQLISFELAVIIIMFPKVLIGAVPDRGGRTETMQENGDKNEFSYSFFIFLCQRVQILFDPLFCDSCGSYPKLF